MVIGQEYVDEYAGKDEKDESYFHDMSIRVEVIRNGL